MHVVLGNVPVGGHAETLATVPSGRTLPPPELLLADAAAAEEAAALLLLDAVLEELAAAPEEEAAPLDAEADAEEGVDVDEDPLLELDEFVDGAGLHASSGTRAINQPTLGVMKPPPMRGDASLRWNCRPRYAHRVGYRRAMAPFPSTDASLNTPRC